jgi:hypothetical protein
MSDTSNQTDSASSTNHKIKAFLSLWIPGLIGLMALVYQIYQQSDKILETTQQEIPLSLLLIASFIQPLLLMSLAIVVGLSLCSKTELRSELVEKANGKESFIGFEKNIAIAVIYGILTGTLIILFDYAFIHYVEPIPEGTAFSERSVALTIAGMLYGGIVEEILLRWGLMSFFVWIIHKIFEKTKATPSAFNYWSSNSVVGLLFAAGHLPAVFAMFEDPSAAFLTRTIILNTIAGVIYGYLFFSKNLETAMIAHASTHLAMTVLTVILF